MADQRSQNFVRVDPTTGAVVGLFPGGIEIEPGAFGAVTTPPPSGNSVTWKRQSDGSVVAFVYAYVTGAGPPHDRGLQAHALGKDATDTLAHVTGVIDSAGTTQTQFFHDHQPGAANKKNSIYASVVGDSGTGIDLALIQGDGASNWLQLLTAGKQRAEWGQGTITWPGASLDSNVAEFSHNLGVTPTFGIGILDSPPEWSILIQRHDKFSATKIGFRAHSVSGVNPPANASCACYWLALG